MGKQIDTQTVAPVWIVGSDEAEHSDWLKGFALYAEGKSDSRCANHAQVVGWYAACTADAACQTIDHMAAEGQTAEDFDLFLSSIEDDYDWIRTGC